MQAQAAVCAPGKSSARCERLDVPNDANLHARANDAANLMLHHDARQYIWLGEIDEACKVYEQEMQQDSIDVDKLLKAQGVGYWSGMRL